LNGKWWRRDSNGYPHIIDNARPHCVTANIARRCPTTEIQDGGYQAGNGKNIWPVTGCDAILNFYPIFSTMPDSDMLLSTLSDFARHRQT